MMRATQGDIARRDDTNNFEKYSLQIIVKLWKISEHVLRTAQEFTH